jgi:hypothetical protein
MSTACCATSITAVEDPEPTSSEPSSGSNPPLLHEALFRRSWTDIIVGRRSVADGLAEALAQIGAAADVESVGDGTERRCAPGKSLHEVGRNSRFR